MSNELRDLRISNGLPAMEIADAVKTVFPKFDRYLLSKCEQPDDYGVKLLPRGMEAARALVPGWKPKKKDGHRNQFRIYCRMDEQTYLALIAQIRCDGFNTVQDWMLGQVKAYIEASCL